MNVVVFGLVACLNSNGNMQFRCGWGESNKSTNQNTIYTNAGGKAYCGVLKLVSLKQPHGVFGVLGVTTLSKSGSNTNRPAISDR